jgi:hypothetical protein
MSSALSPNAEPVISTDKLQDRETEGQTNIRRGRERDKKRPDMSNYKYTI